jgi:quercetin dioxygenase-like cupin family protein
VLAAGTRSEGEERKDVSGIDARALARMVQHFDKVEKEEYSWGWIRWLMNGKLDPKAEMTFGIVQINAGQANPPHIHPNCEEQLYVLSGLCEHRIGKQTVVLKAGDMIRIPRKVPHSARTFDKEAMRAVIVYSSGDRRFESAGQ